VPARELGNLHLRIKRNFLEDGTHKYMRFFFQTNLPHEQKLEGQKPAAQLSVHHASVAGDRIETQLDVDEPEPDPEPEPELDEELHEQNSDGQNGGSELHTVSHQLSVTVENVAVQVRVVEVAEPVGKVHMNGTNNL
jgi:hypothetical protein